jgi:hypothetical protein
MTFDADFAPDLGAGAHNLLLNCAGLTPGQRLLIVYEGPALGWYDQETPQAVANEARRLGTDPTMLEVGDPAIGKDARVEEAIAAHDIIVFFARIGDQDRFADPAPGKTFVMCYARDAGMLASAFGRTTHQALLELKQAVNEIMLSAGNIEITCPLGTAISGGLSQAARAEGKDVGIQRFPMGVPQPVDASGFSGQVALARFLTPTGSRVYDPAFLKIDRPVIAEVSSGRITGFSGDPADESSVRQHYQSVADLFDIDSNVVHSWHAGIHPGCAYTRTAAADPDRWSNTAFCNPRFLHFHTCGDYPPGEICWMVLDPTILVDGEALWENGRLRVEAFTQSRRCLDNWPELRALFAHPSDQIGV